MRNVSDKRCTENKNDFPVFNIFFSSFENPTFYEIMWKKYCRVGQTTNDNMAHTHLMLDT